jgi:hypothetical protein
MESPRAKDSFECIYVGVLTDGKCFKKSSFPEGVFQGKILNLRNFMHGKSPSGKLDFFEALAVR